MIDKREGEGDKRNYLKNGKLRREGRRDRDKTIFFNGKLSRETQRDRERERERERENIFKVGLRN